MSRAGSSTQTRLRGSRQAASCRRRGLGASSRSDRPSGQSWLLETFETDSPRVKVLPSPRDSRYFRHRTATSDPFPVGVFKQASNRLVTGVLGYACLGTCVFRLSSLLAWCVQASQVRHRCTPPAPRTPAAPAECRFDQLTFLKQKHGEAGCLKHEQRQADVRDHGRKLNT